MTMKSTFSLFLLISALIVTSCVYDKDITDTTTGAENMQITFTLVTGGEGSRATRADDDPWSDNQDKDNGTDYENRIDPGKLQVLVYSTDNKLLGKIEQLTYTQREDQKYIYDFTGKLPLDSWNLSNQFNAKIVVLANCDVYNPSAGTELSDISQQEFTYTPVDDENTTPSAPIPMWGIKTVDAVLTPNVVENIGDIYILRAMSKIKLTCAAGITLSDVKLSKYNQKGNVTPNYNNIENLDKTESLNMESQSLNPISSIKELAIPFIKATDGYYIYVPECSADDAPVIKLKAGNTATDLSDYEIPLQKFNDDGTADGNNIPLIRNHIYQYNIRSVGKLQVDFQVLPWNLVTSEIGWNVTAYMYPWQNPLKDADNNATKGDAEAGYCLVNYPGYDDKDKSHKTLKWDNDKKESGSSGAAYYLVIDGPEGATWKAVLSKPDLFKLNTTSTWEDANGVQRYCAATGIVRKDAKGDNIPYQIKVEAKKPWFTPNSQTDFDGTLTEEGTQWEKDYGENGGPYTDLTIQVSLDGVRYYNVVINPVVDKEGFKSYYTDKRRFAGGDDYYIRIWQLKAKKSVMYDEMNEGNTANATYKRK